MDKKQIKASDTTDRPWVPGALGRRTASVLTLCSVLCATSTLILGIASYKTLNRPPRILLNDNGVFVEGKTSEKIITRDHVEKFVNYVVPQLHQSTDGKQSGLANVNHLVNPNILIEMEATAEKYNDDLESRGINQFAIVNAIKPETLTINRDKKTIYCEAVGLIGLTDRDGKARTIPTQWRMLMYIHDVIPVTNKDGVITDASSLGNERGIYLHQMEEQPLGTVNENKPPLTQEDIRELQEQQEKREALNRLNQ